MSNSLLNKILNVNLTRCCSKRLRLLWSRLLLGSRRSGYLIKNRIIEVDIVLTDRHSLVSGRRLHQAVQLALEAFFAGRDGRCQGCDSVRLRNLLSRLLFVAHLLLLGRLGV